MSNIIIKRAVLGATLLGLAGALAFLLVACGQTSAAPTARTPAAAAPRPEWHALPAAPIAVDAALTSVWTGRELIVSGVRAGQDGTFTKATEVAAAYDPAAESWRRLATPPRMDGPCGRSAAWTGTEMLVWGCFGKAAAFNPKTNRWRTLPQAPTGQGITAWTGRELIGWGGGCCGDAWSDGSAYDPATDTWRRLTRSPLAPSQQPIGAWTGHELVLFVAGINAVEDKPYPTSLARAAAYDPATDTWRRIASPPLPIEGTAVWNGSEILVTGRGRTALAYDPATNRWHRLTSLPAARIVETTVWTGSRLLLWGPADAATSNPVHGFAYDPSDDRWSTLPAMPFEDPYTTAVAWTGHALLAWPGSGAAAALNQLPERSTR
jgi:N-acetylneuraminic acid mutarotase